MQLGQYAIIALAGVVAGAINAVAGGGTLLTFPLLVWLGRDPVVANATNALSLWPGSLAGAYALRAEAWQARAILRLLLPVSVVGSLLGGVLLLATPSRVFADVVPYLVLLATLLMAAQRFIPRALTPTDEVATHALKATNATNQKHNLALMAGQFCVAIYGGYFGAAAGILMLAALGAFGLSDIHQRNAVKNVLATANNGVAGIYFLFAGAVNVTDFLVLSASAVLGGYVAGHVSRGWSRRTVEWIVLAVGISATLALALR